MMIIEYDRSPEASVERKLQTLVESIQRAFEEIPTDSVAVESVVVSDADLPEWLDGISDIEELKSLLEIPVTPEDSGWIDVVLTSMFTQYETGTMPHFRRIGNMVELTGVVKPTAEITGSITRHDMFTLPEGYRPPRDITFVCQGSKHAVWMLHITAATGGASFSRYRIGDSYVDASTSAWLPFHCMFNVDDTESEGTVTLVATHDGKGNVTIYGAPARHDGAGNVSIVY